MNILPDVGITIKDGGLGSVFSGTDVLGAVGVGSIPQDGPVLLSSYDDLENKVGEGPLRDFLEGVYSQVNVSCHAVVLPGSVAGSVSGVTPGSANIGTGTISVSGSPVNGFRFRVVIAAKGSLNTAVFRLEKNGLLGGKVTVPAGGGYEVPGLGLKITFAGTFEEGDEYSFSTTAPSCTNGELLKAIEVLKSRPVRYRHIAVAGVTTASFWSAFAVKLEEFSRERRWTWGSTGVRPKGKNETTDAYVQALAGTERGSVTSKRLMIVGSWLNVADVEGYDVERCAHGKMIGRIFRIGVATSPGWTRLGNLPGVEGMLYEVNPAQVKLLEDAGYAVCRYYDGKKGVYISDSTLAEEKDGDFDTSVRIEVMNKACLLVRDAQFPYLKQSFDVLEDGRVPELAQVAAAGQQALDKMQRDKEISSGRIVVPGGQDILATKTMEEEIFIVPRGQTNEIKAIIRYENPSVGGE